MTAVKTGAELAVRVVDLVAGYGEQPVLHRIALTVAPGEMLAVVGPNGAGKSTLLRVLSGASSRGREPSSCSAARSPPTTGARWPAAWRRSRRRTPSPFNSP